MPRPLDPYLKVLREFHHRGVHYALIGVSAINYYAKSPLQILLTGDFDIFVEPSSENVWRAAQVLWNQDFTLSARGKPIHKRSRRKIEEAVRSLTTLQGKSPDHHIVELSLNVSGFTFQDIQKDVVTFRAASVPVRVASLKKLLRMKEIADRPKDRLFLERFRLMRE